MTRTLAMLTAVIMALMATPAQAQSGSKDALPAWRPGRATMFFHGALRLDDQDPNRFYLTTHGVPSPDLASGLMPIVYLGVRMQPVEQFGFEPMLGWRFVVDEPVFSFRLHVKEGRFSGFLNTNFRTPSFGGYLLVMLEGHIFPWLKAGVEYEGFGSWPDRFA